MPDTPVATPADQLIASAPAEPAAASGCHAGAEKMRAAAAAAGKSETLERYAQDYPAGPHDHDTRIDFCVC